MRRRRILTLLLLLCGFSSAPLFSLEQSAGDDLAASPAPQMGTRPPGKALQPGTRGAGADPGEGMGQGSGPASIPPAAGWPVHSPRGALHRAPADGIVPLEVRLTYRANAPPSPAVSM